MSQGSMTDAELHAIEVRAELLDKYLRGRVMLVEYARVDRTLAEDVPALAAEVRRLWEQDPWKKFNEECVRVAKVLEEKGR